MRERWPRGGKQAADSGRARPCSEKQELGADSLSSSSSSSSSLFFALKIFVLNFLSSGTEIKMVWTYFFF